MSIAFKVLVSSRARRRQGLSAKTVFLSVVDVVEKLRDMTLAQQLLTLTHAVDTAIRRILRLTVMDRAPKCIISATVVEVYALGTTTIYFESYDAEKKQENS